MEINKISTLRKYCTEPAWDLVYEWEDEIASSLNVELNFETKLTKALNGISKLLNFNYLSLCIVECNILKFNINARAFDNIYNSARYINYIIDFWISDAEFNKFVHAYDRNKLLLISSREAYEYILRKNSKLNVKHLALSISDKYKIKPTDKFEKVYDVVMFGRQNPILKESCERYAKGHPSFVYVYRVIENGQFNYYTNKGEIVGDCTNHDSIIRLLRKSKVGLYTTPSMDNNKPGTNGYNQVTPRFLELIASGCHIIARYKSNPDTDYYELSSFCENTESYHHFEEQMDRYLSKEVDMVFYSEYLSKHYTSVRINQLKDILKNE